MEGLVFATNLKIVFAVYNKITPFGRLYYVLVRQLVNKERFPKVSFFGHFGIKNVKMVGVMKINHLRFRQAFNVPSFKKDCLYNLNFIEIPEVMDHRLPRNTNRCSQIRNVRFKKDVIAQKVNKFFQLPIILDINIQLKW